MARRMPQLKLVLLGDEAVGKTSLLTKWTHSAFDPSTPPTIGGAAQNRRDQIEGETFAFQIWDTAGAEKFRALTPLYARDAKGAALVFDVTRRASFENLAHWVSFLHQQGAVPFVVLGNKEDLAGAHAVTPDDALNFALAVGWQYFATSAKTGAGVDLAFRALELEAVAFFRAAGAAEQQATIELDAAAGPPDAKCC
jgi:small GTP-binding protein